MTSCDDAAVMISALIDGELPLEEVARVRAHLDMCGDCASRADLERRLKEFLHDKLAAVETPHGLRGRILSAMGEESESMSGEKETQRPNPTPQKSMWWLPLAVIVTVLASMGGMLLVTETGEMGQDGPDPLKVRLVSIHMAATGAGVFQVRSRDRDELSAWYSERAGRQVVVPSLAALGLEPVGGRMLDMDERPVPMVVYQDAIGQAEPVVLVMGGPGFPLHMESGDPLPEGGRRSDFQGAQLLYLERGGAPWMAISKASPERMSEVMGALLSADSTP
ncbi:MAG: zf-HC2 domain-containing protein [Nitrospirota bacterium]|nr:zf-HC2 domain-containing protein [Nitrospirota bacterium]